MLGRKKTEPADGPKLRIWPAALEGYRFTFRNPVTALRLILLPALCITGIHFALFGFEALFGILWNVITVSLRQTIIPEELLGRVNSVYRFFAWGMMPIGAAIGGVVVFVVERMADRDFALRSTWFACGIVHLGLFVFARTKLTTEKIEAARAAAVTPPAS